VVEGVYVGAGVLSADDNAGGTGARLPEAFIPTS
jgi:hypothetical protein